MEQYHASNFIGLLHVVDDSVDVDVDSDGLAAADHVDKLLSCPRPFVFNSDNQTTQSD